MITVESIYGKFTCYENDNVVKEILSCGAYSRPEIGMILKFLKDGDTVLDIGAHIGTFSIPIKSKIGISGKLYAFEANPVTYGLLKKNLLDNSIDATIFNKGVSDQSGILYLRAKSFEKRDANDSDGSLNSGADYLTSKLSEDMPDMIEIELIKIDDVVSGPVHFMKVDVEGMELNVFRSAEKTIDQHKPIIYSEYFEPYITRAGHNFCDFELFFKNKGYDFFINGNSRVAANDKFELVKIPSPKYIRGQVDFLMVSKESDRYPIEFTTWYKKSPLMFLWNRFRNLLKDLNAKYKLKR
jgi:FkbM family methyltransferase